MSAVFFGAENDDIPAPLPHWTQVIPEQYKPERVDLRQLGSWLSWSLGFFTEPVLQNPYLDVTLQHDVTAAHSAYQSGKAQSAGRGTFFAYIVWHLAKTLANHPSMNLRRIDDQWYLLHNPPIFVPVAIGGEERFRAMVLDDVYQQSYPDFVDNYLHQLQRVRQSTGKTGTSDVFRYAQLIGNLPYLRFSALTLHWRPDQMVGQSYFYFGQRYQQDDRLLIPLAAKLHHACTDPLMLNELLSDFAKRFSTPAAQPA